MKNDTKYKIIQWVTKVLGYQPPPIQTYEQYTRKIKNIVIVNEVDKERYSHERELAMIRLRIGDELEKKGAIDIVVEKGVVKDRLLIRGTVEYLDPLKITRS